MYTVHAAVPAMCTAYSTHGGHMPVQDARRVHAEYMRSTCCGASSRAGGWSAAIWRGEMRARTTIVPQGLLAAAAPTSDRVYLRVSE